MTEVDGGDKSKFDQAVFTGLGTGLEFKFWDTKFATFAIKSSSVSVFLRFNPLPV